MTFWHLQHLVESCFVAAAILRVPCRVYDWAVAFWGVLEHCRFAKRSVLAARDGDGWSVFFEAATRHG